MNGLDSFVDDCVYPVAYSDILLPPPWYEIDKILTIKNGGDFDFFESIYARSCNQQDLFPLE